MASWRPQVRQKSIMRRWSLIRKLFFLVWTLSVPVWAFQNPLNVAAVASGLAARAPLFAVARAGERLVAVGARGHVVFSDDGGSTWRQAAVPVSVDLVGVSFPSARAGWAVGHGGVVLHSADGGLTWTRQLSGKQAAEIAVAYYEGPGRKPGTEGDRVLSQARAQLRESGLQPFLDVHFEDEKSGWVVGTFNRIFRTEDGGKTWTPWMDRTGNLDEFHFYAIRGAHGRVFLAGEQGRVWRLDAPAGCFRPAPTPYNGTLFGVAIGRSSLLAFGMRGALFRSDDDGRTWVRVALGTGAGITGGTVLPSGHMAVVSQGGGLWLSRDGRTGFELRAAARPMSYAAIAVTGGGDLLLAGLSGVAVEKRP